jgi:hypothetical protein
MAFTGRGTDLLVPAVYCARCHHTLREEFEGIAGYVTYVSPPRVCPSCGLEDPTTPVNSIMRSWVGNVVVWAPVVGLVVIGMALIVVTVWMGIRYAIG